MYVVIILGILMLLALCNGKVRDILNIPRSKHIYAKVVSKERENLVMSAWAGDVINYKIIFEVNNESVAFAVSGKVYNSVSDGSWGVLVYGGSRFRGFHVDKKIPDMVKSKKKKKQAASAVQKMKQQGF